MSRRDRAITIIKHWKSLLALPNRSGYCPSLQLITYGSSQIYRWGPDPQAMSGALPQCCGPAVRELTRRKSPITASWDKRCVGSAGMWDSVPLCAIQNGRALGLVRNLALAARAGASEIHAVISDPVFVTSYSGAPHEPSTDQKLTMPRGIPCDIHQSSDSGTRNGGAVT